MRVGMTVLPEYSGESARKIWASVEEYGFDHGWTFDHLGWDGLLDGPWYGTVPTLTLAALVTSRLEIGTLVASPNFRHPVAFSRDLTG
ncbi:LLM class flavin-dependent oxidoreductase, partial [Streptomyces flaveus]|uniref:LLM class flavin-dependent oxidoreductase n=1 Tax=Streptomyces flaveus TaxID=66370 RepID=UPI003320E2AF